MDDALRDGVMITVIGMGSVLGLLVLLWGLMALLARALSRPKTRAAPQVVDHAGPPPTAEEMAAIAAALAILAKEREDGLMSGSRLPPVLTRWQAVGFARHLRSWQPPRKQRA